MFCRAGNNLARNVIEALDAIVREICYPSWLMTGPWQLEPLGIGREMIERGMLEFIIWKVSTCAENGLIGKSVVKQLGTISEYLCLFFR